MYTRVPGVFVCAYLPEYSVYCMPHKCLLCYLHVRHQLSTKYTIDYWSYCYSTACMKPMTHAHALLIYTHIYYE